MAATKPSEESPAADVAVVDQTAPVTPEAEPVAAAPQRRGRKLALIITGAVVAAGLLFGGGVAVGLAIPTGGPGFSQNGGPGGGFPGGGQDGERPQMPGNGQQGGQTDDGSTSDGSTTDDGA